MPLPGKVRSGERKETAAILYNLNDAFFIFFRGPFSALHLDQAAEAMAPSLNRYLRDGLMDQLAPVRTKPLRTIPIEGTIEDPRRIAPYEDVMGIVESQNFLAVCNCACRQRKRVDPDSAQCEHPEEVCLHFGDLAHYLVDNGLSRQISKEEAKRYPQSRRRGGAGPCDFEPAKRCRHHL